MHSLEIQPVKHYLFSRDSHKANLANIKRNKIDQDLFFL